MTAAQRPAAGLRAWPVLACALAAFAWLAFSIAFRPLSLPEEGRYVGVAWEMLRSGDWLVPTENGLPFFHKPPLFYWLTAASMHVFGTSEAPARFASLLAATLGAIALYRLAGRWMGERTARWSVLVLVTEPFFFGAAQFANLDLLVATCIAFAILLAGHAALRIRQGLPYRGVVICAWIAMALGLLAKGLIGVVLPGLVVLVWLVLTGQARTILKLLSPAGLAVFALVAAPWFVGVQMRHPGFAHFFFVYQHFERFTASGFNNVQPWWFFAAIAPGLTLPWSLWLIGSTVRARVGETAEATLWRRLMWTWLVTVLVFFSIPQSKPIGYSMPVLFPIAVLAAEAIVVRLAAGGGAGKARIAAIASAALAALICLVAIVYTDATYHRDNTELARTLARQRTPGDPVVFVGEFFFDVPLHARLTEPVAVISDWKDPTIAQRDNWRRELAEAAPFAPALAARVLVDTAQGLALRCGSAPLWVLVKSGAEEAPVAALPGATRVAVSNRVALWRVAPERCTGGSADTRRP
ncbi:MAG: ArnT family glycosyltransferase [Caldimonas sp.]